MDSNNILQRLRIFLLLIAAAIFIGTPIELWFTEHFKSPVQFIPFILSGLGLLAVAIALIWTKRSSLLSLRVVMIVVIMGSALGLYEHLAHNLAFELDIRPNSTLGAVFIDALSGASPLLAPGILALGAVLAIAATYYHPALGNPIDRIL